MYSYVQIRGSIPLLWSQKADLKYKPKPKLQIDADQFIAFQNYINNQVKAYGSNYLINLIDQKGSEAKLGSFLLDTVNRFDNNQLKYIAFDFHKECSGFKYQNIEKLGNNIKLDLQKFSYFEIDNGKIKNQQMGVFRTNCIDSLDRTNVVQSFIGLKILREQLLSANIIQQNQELSHFTYFQSLLQNVWANNADALSIQYTGTPALKTEFTRTGKRTWRGALDDGKYSLLRYYKNNFSDGFRQDAFDLILGNYKVNVVSPSPFVNKSQFMAFFGIILLLIYILFATLFSINGLNDVQFIKKSGVFVFCFALLSYLIQYLFKNGQHFVDNPHFVGLV